MSQPQHLEIYKKGNKHYREIQQRKGNLYLSFCYYYSRNEYGGGIIDRKFVIIPNRQTHLNFKTKTNAMNKKQYQHRLKILEAFCQVKSLRNSLNWANEQNKDANKVHQNAQGDWKMVTFDNVLHWSRLFREAKMRLRDALIDFRKLIKQTHTP